MLLVGPCRGGGRPMRLPAARHLRFQSQHSNPKRFEVVPFNPKRVVLEVFGPTGAIATINYLDVNAQPQHADDVTLPWSYDASTTQPGVFLNVVAQGTQ
jgi:Mycobacterium membrane protein